MHMRIFVIVYLIRVQTKAYITLRSRCENPSITLTVTDLAHMLYEKREIEETVSGCQ